MDAEMRAMTAMLRRMPAADAADWLLAHHPRGSPEWGKALLALAHISLRKADNHRLAVHYLAGAPYVNGQIYHLFSKLLGLAGFLRVLSDVVRLGELAEPRARLLMYYLRPMLDAAETERDREAASAFMAAYGEARGALPQPE